MKRFISIVLFAGWYHLAASSQTFKIRSGQSVSSVIPDAEIYQYPAFRPGMVFFRNKTSADGKLNYNYLTQELFFLGTAGDSLSLANPLEVDSVVIDAKRLFYVVSLFVTLDTVIGNTKIASTKIFIPLDKKLIGPFGIASGSVGNINSVNQSFRSGTLDLEPGEELTLSKEPVYFIGDRLNHFIPLNKKDIFSFYSKKENALRTYLKQDHINLSGRQGIISLVKYMESN